MCFCTFRMHGPPTDYLLYNTRRGLTSGGPGRASTWTPRGAVLEFYRALFYICLPFVRPPLIRAPPQPAHVQRVVDVLDHALQPACALPLESCCKVRVTKGVLQRACYAGVLQRTRYVGRGGCLRLANVRLDLPPTDSVGGKSAPYVCKTRTIVASAPPSAPLCHP